MALLTTIMALVDKDPQVRPELAMELSHLHLTTRLMDKGVTHTFAWTTVVYSVRMRLNSSHSGEHSERKRR